MKNLLKLRSSKNKHQTKQADDEMTQQHHHNHQVVKPRRVLGFVLGGGSFSIHHDDNHNDSSSCSIIDIHPHSRKPSRRSRLDSSASTISTAATSSPLGSSRRQFLRHSSSFLRVADLNLEDFRGCSSSSPNSNVSSGSSSSDNNSILLNNRDDSSCITWSDSGDDSKDDNINDSLHDSVANFSYAAADPPPGMDHDPQERWIALDDGAGSHAPIAPRAVQALARIGLEAALDEPMWTQHTAARHFRAAPWHAATWPLLSTSTSTTDNGSNSSSSIIRNDVLPPAHSKQEEMVLLWTGKFHHGLYGSDLPAVRAAGIIPAAPKALFDLLIDSSRVKLYNKMSLGRQDLLVLQDNLQTSATTKQHQEGPFGKSVVTKVMRSKSSPPLVSKTIELVSMLHAQELDDGSGYLIVTRAVTHPEDRNDVESSSTSSVLRSEILLGVNIIRRVEGDPNRCVMINMIHMRSPMVPMMIANRIGASAAAGFIKDLRAAF